MTDASAVPLNPQPADSGPALSQVQRVVYTFTAPSKTFTDIRRCASWWLPFLLGVLFTYGFVFAVQSRVGWDRVAENTLRQNPRAAEQMANASPEQRDNMLSMTRKFTVGALYGSPALALIVAAVLALVLWGTINFVFGGEATFAQVFAVWMYGTLPLAIKGLLVAITLFAGVDPDSFRLENPLGTNLGFFLSAETPKWLSALATSFDLFSLWSYVLVGIGLAIVARVKRSSGLMAVFGWWVLLLLFRVGMAALRG